MAGSPHYKTHPTTFHSRLYWTYCLKDNSSIILCDHCTPMGLVLALCVLNIMRPEYYCVYYSVSSLIDGLVQDCSISSALAIQILQSCLKPLIWASVVVRMMLLKMPLLWQYVCIVLNFWIWHDRHERSLRDCSDTITAWNLGCWCTVIWSRLGYKRAMLGYFVSIPWNFNSWPW